MYFLGLRMYLVQPTFSPPPCTSSAATSTVGGSEHWCWRWGWRTWRHYDMLALTKNCQSGVQIVKCICLKISDGTHIEPIKWLWRVEEVPLRCLQCTYSPQLLTCLPSSWRWQRCRRWWRWRRRWWWRWRWWKPCELCDSEASSFTPNLPTSRQRSHWLVPLNCDIIVISFIMMMIIRCFYLWAEKS